MAPAGQLLIFVTFACSATQALALSNKSVAFHDPVSMSVWVVPAYHAPSNQAMKRTEPGVAHLAQITKKPDGGFATMPTIPFESIISHGAQAAALVAATNALWSLGASQEFQAGLYEAKVAAAPLVNGALAKVQEATATLGKATAGLNRAIKVEQSKLVAALRPKPRSTKQVRLPQPSAGVASQGGLGSGTQAISYKLWLGVGALMLLNLGVVRQRRPVKAQGPNLVPSQTVSTSSSSAQGVVPMQVKELLLADEPASPAPPAAEVASTGSGGLQVPEAAPTERPTQRRGQAPQRAARSDTLESIQEKETGDPALRLGVPGYVRQRTSEIERQRTSDDGRDVSPNPNQVAFYRMSTETSSQQAWEPQVTDDQHLETSYHRLGTEMIEGRDEQEKLAQSEKDFFGVVSPALQGS